MIHCNQWRNYVPRIALAAERVAPAQVDQWYAEAEAHRIGARNMSLTTIPTYIAGIKLYERYGFKTTKTVTSPSYEKRTGIKGRVFLEKELDPAEAEPSS